MNTRTATTVPSKGGSVMYSTINGPLVRQAIQQEGLVQAEVAKLCGINNPDFSKILNQRHKPPRVQVHKAVALSQLLSIPLDQLTLDTMSRNEIMRDAANRSAKTRMKKARVNRPGIKPGPAPHSERSPMVYFDRKVLARAFDESRFKTIVELADKIGVPRSSLARLFGNGKTARNRAQESIFAKVCEALGLDMDLIVTSRRVPKRKTRSTSTRTRIASSVTAEDVIRFLKDNHVVMVINGRVR